MKRKEPSIAWRVWCSHRFGAVPRQRLSSQASPFYLLKGRRKWLCQEHPAVLLEAGPGVEAPGRVTFPTRLDEQGANPQLDARLPNRCQSSGAVASPPGGRANEEVIDKPAEAAEFHAERQREHQVSDHHAFWLHQPNPAEPGVIEECREGASRGLAGQLIAGLPVELGHKRDKFREVLLAGRSNWCRHRSTLDRILNVSLTGAGQYSTGR